MIIVTFTGIDSTYANTVHARHIYYPNDLRVAHRFTDVVSRLPDGRALVDYRLFDETEPLL